MLSKAKEDLAAFYTNYEHQKETAAAGNRCVRGRGGYISAHAVGYSFHLWGSRQAASLPREDRSLPGLCCFLEKIRKENESPVFVRERKQEVFVLVVGKGTFRTESDLFGLGLKAPPALYVFEQRGTVVCTLMENFLCFCESFPW
jgi:hypothetical protein